MNTSSECVGEATDCSSNSSRLFVDSFFSLSFELGLL